MKIIKESYITDYRKKSTKEEEESWPKVILMGMFVIAACVEWVMVLGVLVQG